jgi:hypothetical protein
VSQPRFLDFDVLRNHRSHGSTDEMRSSPVTFDTSE